TRPLDPWATMSAAVGRSRDGREPWHPEQAIDRAAALDASVRTRVAVGERADLVVVERDPLAASTSADDLRAMRVSATLLGGRFTHDTLGG
ncbi:amidohydrolase, partial [Clavibacter michiganensis subsp. michiganensis]|nr:amidohydrolase [Clavibacter michiganensis subsp. michiganensis]